MKVEQIFSMRKQLRKQSTAEFEPNFTLSHVDDGRRLAITSSCLVYLTSGSYSAPKKLFHNKFKSEKVRKDDRLKPETRSSLTVSENRPAWNKRRTDSLCLFGTLLTLCVRFRSLCEQNISEKFAIESEASALKC